MKVRASIVTERLGPWHTESIEIDEPRANEVRVKMAFAGMCHSDEHLRTGDMVPEPSLLEMISGRDSMYPVIGGHEGSGVVEAVGENVTSLKPGDHVVTSFIPSCGRCWYCASGRQYLCDLGAYTLAGPMISDGTWRHHLGDEDLNRMCQLGTFAEYVVANETSLIRIEPWYDMKAAALISCGLSTGFGSAVNRGGVKPGDTVAVIGCGGVGAGAIQGAVHAGARAVIAIDTEPTKVERALKIGATHGAANPLEAAFNLLPSLTMGRNCDVVIITVGVVNGELIEQARSILGKGGVLVVTSIAPIAQRDAQLDLFSLAMFNQEIRGTIFGSESPRVQVPRLLQLHHDGFLHVEELITQEYTLDEVQRGYDDLASGKNVRGVIRL